MLQRIADLENQNDVLKSLITRQGYSWKKDELVAMQAKKYVPAKATPVNFYSGSLVDAEIEDDAIVIIELPNQTPRPSPQQKFLDEDMDSERQALFARSSSRPITVRPSRTSKRSLVFIKTDSPKETMENLILLEHQLKAMDCKGRRVYMDKMETDEYDLARAILEKNHIEASYFIHLEDEKEKQTIHRNKHRKSITERRNCNGIYEESPCKEEYQRWRKHTCKGKKKADENCSHCTGNYRLRYITEDGIIISGNYYSKLYKLVDSNFVTEPEDKQVDYLVNYTKLMNRFPDNVDISVIIINERNTKEDITAAYHLKEAGDGLDEYRTDYNHIIDKKIEEGHNEISKEKYIMLTIRTANGLSQAEMEFNSADVSLQEAVKTINKVGVKQLDAIDRLAVMQKILRGSDCVPFHKEYERYFAKHKDDEGNEKLSLDLPALRKSGVSVKDLIAPQVIAKTRQCIQLDDERYCKSYAYANLPQQLDTSFLTNVTNLPYEMVTVIQFKPVPRKKALQLVKMQNTSVKADVIKASQQAYKSGYSTDLINEDLIQAREDAGKLRHDVVNEGKKLFFATMVVSIFGKDDEEIKNITAQYTAKCADYSVTPSYLIGQQVAGLNTAILCGNSKVIIDRMLTSDNACALFPFNIQELTDKKGHFYGSNAISKNMVMYDRKRSRLANGLIFGQSGSGKSFITKGEIIPNLLDGNDDMIILDPENEYHVVAEHFGGRTIDLELKSQYHINPCDMAMEWDDPKATPLAEKCDYM